MKKPITILLLVLFSIVAVVCDSDAFMREKYDAMIVAWSGSITVVRDGKQKSVKSKFPLKLNDSITVAENGWAVVLFGNGNRIKVTSQLEITKEAEEIESDTVSAVAVFKNFFAEKTGYEDLQIAGGVGAATKMFGGDDINPDSLAGVFGVDKEHYVQIISVQGFTADPAPEISWESSIATATYKVTLRESYGDALWSTTTRNMSMPYPPDAKPLERNMAYSLRVEVIPGDGTMVSQSEFQTLSEDNAIKLKEAESIIRKTYSAPEEAAIQGIAIGELYKGMNLFAPALAEFENLIRQDKTDVTSHYAIIDIYRSMGYLAGIDRKKKEVEKLEKELAEQ